MNPLAICTWLESTPVGSAIRESAILFPWIESIHVIGATLVFGFISIIDLRLLGLASNNQAVSRLTDELTPWVWGAFGIALTTGLLMFSSAATKYYGNAPFRLKMALLAAAGVNMLIFHIVTYRDAAQWDLARPPPPAARLAGLASVLLWIAIVAIGRWIGFTLN